MLNKCKYLKIRTKNYKKYFYCSLLHKIINSNECFGCDSAIYHKHTFVREKPLKMENKSISKLNNKKSIKGKIHKLTKATSISQNVKKKVWERDKHRCISCGVFVPVEYANSHIVKRSQLGLGIEENIITQCNTCHKRFDDSILRNDMLIKISKYMCSKYPNWNMNDLKYKKD